jgi:23S rRNA (uracil1939-C5)-methyltransferase
MSDESLFEGEVRGLSTEGYGVVSHPDGRVFFVPGTWPGDRVRAEIRQTKDRYGYAQLSELLMPSSERRGNVPCHYQGQGEGRCGGCPWMIGSYESQLKHKTLRVERALDRAKLLSHSALLKSIQPSEEWGYRNRAQFKTDGTVLGFVAEGSRKFLDIEQCLVLNPAMQERLTQLRRQLPKAEWNPGTGFDWNFIDLDDETDISKGVTLNRRRVFRQGNTSQNEFIKRWIEDKLNGFKNESTSSEGRKALELFCGSGNFTEVLSRTKLFSKILAVEVIGESLNQLKAQSFSNVDIFAADLFQKRDLHRVAERAQGTQLMLLDPPRTGAKDVGIVISKLRSLERILYVSCDVATFVRDAAKWKSLGFSVSEVQPVDLFPHTSHVELLAELRRDAN